MTEVEQAIAELEADIRTSQLAISKLRGVTGKTAVKRRGRPPGIKNKAVSGPVSTAAKPAAPARTRNRLDPSTTIAVLKTEHNYSGKRAKIFGAIKDGMLISDWFTAVKKAKVQPNAWELRRFQEKGLIRLDPPAKAA